MPSLALLPSLLAFSQQVRLEEFHVQWEHAALVEQAEEEEEEED